MPGCGEVKAQRVAAWAQFAQANPHGYLYCFRGGLRSQIVQQWLREAGVDYPRVVGGYKAMRTFLIEILEQAVAQCDFLVLGGMTGTGKTDVLAKLPNALDLEGNANHRGSSVGKRATGQPAQIDSRTAWPSISSRSAMRVSIILYLRTRPASWAAATSLSICIRACSVTR